MKGSTYQYGDPPWDTRTIDTFEAHARKQVSIVHWGQPWYSSKSWPYTYYPFVPSLLDKVVARGSIPMINWNSWDLGAGGSPDQPNFQLIDTISGKHDAYIREWATAAKQWGKPFFLRHNHEMNGTWYPWSEVRNGNQAGEYVQAWRRVHTIFQEVGATNVTWVWCPNATYAGSIPLNRLYPGDAYVDWTCIDSYNWGTNPSKPAGWQSFNQIFKPTYDALSSIAPTKPIMIGETASTEYGGSKAAWIKDALQTQLPQQFPNIKAVLWFNWSTDGMDWVIETSSAAQTAFADSIASPYYATNTFGALPKFSKVQPLSPVTAPATNQVQNGSFESSGLTPWHAPWTVRNDLGATLTHDSSTYAAGTRSFKASMPTASSTQPWQVQVRQGGQALSAGKSYTVSFAAKASTARPILVTLQQASTPYTAYWQQSVALTTNWTTYRYTVTAPSSDAAAMLSVSLAQATGQVWLDNVVITPQ